MKEITTIESNFYYYNSNTLVGISTNSQPYKMLFTNSSTGAYADETGRTTTMNYWLGSQFAGTDLDLTRASFGVRIVDTGRIARLWFVSFIYSSKYRLPRCSPRCIIRPRNHTNR